MGEDQLIARMREILPVGEHTLVWSGDDCAEISAPTGSFLISTDVLVEDVHFRRDWSAAFEIGQRAAMQNLADIMGQGGEPTALVVSLVIPAEIETQWVLDLVAGFAKAVSLTKAGVVGGDLSRGKQLVISVTVCGQGVRGNLPQSVLRSGAKVGDRIAVAGTLGFSAVGLELFTAGNEDKRWEEYRQVFKVPRPPLGLGPVAAAAGASALMDISDGLSTDLGRIAAASGVCCVLSEDGLEPFTQSLAAVAGVVGKTALELVLNGGEDHALLACFPPESEIPADFKVIGEVVPGKRDGLSGVWLDDKPLGSHGWDHFLFPGLE